MFLEYRKQDLKKTTAIALAVLFLDQIVKFIVVKNIFSEIEIYKNYNALFGLPINSNLIFIFFIFLIFVYYFILQKEAELSIGSSASFGLILGGIFGNLADRIFYGYIIEYLNLFNLFVFNIADLAICFGVLLLSWKVLGK